MADRCLGLEQQLQQGVLLGKTSTIDEAARGCLDGVLVGWLDEGVRKGFYRAGCCGCCIRVVDLLTGGLACASGEGREMENHECGSSKGMADKGWHLAKGAAYALNSLLCRTKLH